MSEHVLSTLEAGILTIRINRPDKKNALTLAMYGQMAKALQQANTDAAIGVVIITGSTDCFTSGNDLADFMQVAPQGLGNELHDFMNALLDCTKPVIAAVAGPAIGIGTTLLLHCDFVYACRNTHFKMPFVSLGLCPEFGSSLIIPRLVGQAKANDLLLLGESFNGVQAEAWGIINAALEDGAASFAKARAIAQRLLALSPTALEASKRLIRAPEHALLRSVLQAEGALFDARLRHPEGREALLAFVQKRAPKFGQRI